MIRGLLALAAVALSAAAGAQAAARLTLTSPAFRAGAEIPAVHTCDGRGGSPPLAWRSPPRGTVSFALSVEDPDAPGGTFVHWLAWNIPASARVLAAGAHPPREGANSAGRGGYFGPCPPTGRHRYVFRLYALDRTLALRAGADAAAFHRAVDPHVLAGTSLLATYQRSGEG